jgi:hypothetical protein
MPKSNMSWGQAPSHGQNTHVQGQAPDRGLAETTESDMARGQAPSHGWNTHVQGQAPDRSALGMHLETDA